MEVTGATTSASQPSASRCSGGARGSDGGVPQPDAAKPCASSSNAGDPDVPSVVREILELGRFPGRYKKPANDAEFRENTLAKRLSTQKQKIPKEWWEKVQQLKEKQAEDEAAAAKWAAVLEALPDESTVPRFGQRDVAQA